MECPVSPSRVRMLFPTCFGLSIFLKHPLFRHSTNQKRKEAEEPFLPHTCNSQGYHILSKCRLTSIIVAQVMNFHHHRSLKMAFDITVSGKITCTSLTQ